MLRCEPNEVRLTDRPARRLTGVSIIQDLRYAVRSFARTPGATALALLTIAIGIGANAAIFSVFHSVLIAPVPYPHPERVVVPWRHNPQTGVSISASAADIDRWSSLVPVEAVTSYTGSEMVLTGGAEPESVQVTRVSPTLFDFVGALPALGRRFSPEEAVSDAAGRVVMLSDAAWRSRFGARRDVLGERIILNDMSHEIVGVLRPDFYLPLNRIDMVAPLPTSLVTAETRPDLIPAVLMRLRPGVSIGAAEAALRVALGASRGRLVRQLLAENTSVPSARTTGVVHTAPVDPAVRRRLQATSCPDPAMLGGTTLWKDSGAYWGLATDSNGRFRVLWSDARDGMFRLRHATVEVRRGPGR